MKSILVSAICFVNRNKPGAEIYAAFARKLIDDVIKKSPYDIRIVTNEPEHFKEDIEKYSDRVTINYDDLSNNQIVVGHFNHNLKYKALQNIPSKYDWVLYLDCDAGFTDTLNVGEIDQYIDMWESQGYDMLGTRANAILINELKDHEEKLNKWRLDPSQYNPGNLFSNKFEYYKVSIKDGPFEWFDAVLPSEHVLLFKNNEKMSKMAVEYEKINSLFESQVKLPHVITSLNEAFEIGVAAKLAGYNVGDFGNYGLYHVIKVVCNYNNPQNIRY
jgi:hypothetical protein